MLDDGMIGLPKQPLAAKDVVCEKGHKTSGKAIGGAYEVLVDPSWESQDSEPLPEWIRYVNQ